MSVLDLFKKKTTSVVVASPFEGTAVALEKVPDEAFSSRMIGDGIAVLPTADIVKNALKAPVNVFKTGHAFTYELGELEIIVHAGIETVALKGEGFSVLIKNDATYEVGEPIVKMDMAFIKSKGLSLISPVVIPTMHLVAKLTVLVQDGESLSYGSPLLKIELK